MGFRYRKRINHGGGFRINVSTSGIGYSWGSRGARYTYCENEREEGTFALAGSGSSFVKEGKKQKRKKQRSSRKVKISQETRNKNNEEAATTEEPITESLNVDAYQESVYVPLFRAIRRRRRCIVFSDGLMVFFFLYGLISHLWFIGFCVACCLNVYRRTKGKVKMVYLFEDGMEQQYQKIYTQWLALNHNEKFTKITHSVKNNTRRTHKTGALREVMEMPIEAIQYCPPFLSTNITPFGLKIDTQYVLFFPDTLLLVDGTRLGVVSYKRLTMETGIFTCLETGNVPSDTEIIATQFEHSKKDGSPDLRYKENKELPVCKYGHIVLSSLQGLHIELIASNASTVENFSQAVEESSVFNVKSIHS